MNRPDPILIKDVLSPEEYNDYKNMFPVDRVKSFDFQQDFSRYAYADGELEKYAELLTPMAREIFGSKNLLPTYTLFAHYEGPNAKLWKHKDDNACTYTIDMCVYQKYAWDLWVENKPYTLYPNEALAYYGNDQEHWRESFPQKETNFVGMTFFHFAEPEHWWFTKGRDYLEVIRGQITEQEWLNRKGLSL